MDSLMKGLSSLADGLGNLGDPNLDPDSEDERLEMLKYGPPPTANNEQARRMSTSTSKSKLGSITGLAIAVEPEHKTKKKTVHKEKSLRSIKLFEKNIINKVVIIQRFARGYITRKRFKRLKRVSSVPKLFKEFIQEGEV